MGKFDQRAEEFGMLVGAHESARRVEELPLDWIMPDPDNPRTEFDEAELAELAASITVRGVLQPIIVGVKGADGKHLIRMGERRYRASHLAGRKTIPAIVVPSGEGDDVLADQIVENDQRAGLSASELAHAIERMLASGKSQTEIAQALGRSKQFVSLYAAFRDMAPYLREAIDTTPIRVLYDLHRAAKKHPVEVGAFVAGFGERGATLSEGTRFIASLRASTEPEAGPVSPEQSASAVAATHGPAADKAKSVGQARPRLPPVLPSPVKVTLGTRPARLVLPERVRIAFEDGSEEDVALTDLSFG